MTIHEWINCPFCDSDEVQVISSKDEYYHIDTFMGWCGDCNAQGPPCKTIAEARIAWNKRGKH